MQKKRVAIIGGGISGLASAYYLSKSEGYEITVFESEAEPGGHAHTHVHQGVPIDTTVIGFHTESYPMFTQLIKELGVYDQTHVFRQDLCFHSPQGVDYICTFNPRTVARNPLKVWKTVKALQKFSRSLVAHIDDRAIDAMSLIEYLRFARMSEHEINYLILPMIHMFVGMQPDQLQEMPARFMVEHLYTHKVLHYSSLNSWRAWDKGTATYINALVEKSRAVLRLNTPIAEVSRLEDGTVSVRPAGGACEIFDAAILATPPSIAFRMLRAPSAIEQHALGRWTHAHLMKVLHTDLTLLPKHPGDRGFWNPYSDPDTRECGATYLLSKIQPAVAPDLAVTWGPIQPIAPSRVIFTKDIALPQFTKQSLSNWKDLPLLNQQGGRIYYCGAYFSFGWHESGVTSALDVVKIVRSALDATESDERLTRHVGKG